MCEHSLYHMALKGMAGYELKLDPESVVISTLFHDLCKVNFYKKDIRNQKVNGVWTEAPCYTVEEKYPLCLLPILMSHPLTLPTHLKGVSSSGSLNMYFIRSARISSARCVFYRSSKAVRRFSMPVSENPSVS